MVVKSVEHLVGRMVVTTAVSMAEQWATKWVRRVEKWVVYLVGTSVVYWVEPMAARWVETLDANSVV